MAVFTKNNVIARVVNFYVSGFREMTVGKTLWMIIIIKLVVMFAVLKLFFFPDFLGSNFDNDNARADYVRNELTTRR